MAQLNKHYSKIQTAGAQHTAESYATNECHMQYNTLISLQS